MRRSVVVACGSRAQTARVAGDSRAMSDGRRAPGSAHSTIAAESRERAASHTGGYGASAAEEVRRKLGGCSFGGERGLGRRATPAATGLCTGGARVTVAACVRGDGDAEKKGSRGSSWRRATMRGRGALDADGDPERRAETPPGQPGGEVRGSWRGHVFSGATPVW
jgi:hypothetical protein